MKTKDIRELSLPELEKKVRDSRDKLLHLRLKKQTGQVEKTHEITALRKDIARLETIHQQRLAAKQSA